MNILAVDTSTKFLSIAISRDANLIARYNEICGRNLAKDMLPIINRLLKKIKLSINDIDVFGLGLGPGSFTGLRIGFSIIKGMDFCLKKPIVGIPSLDIIAHNAVNSKTNYICPIIDAKRNLIYTCLYKNKEGNLRRITDYMLVSVDDLLAKLENRTLFMGDGLIIYKKDIAKKIKNMAVFTREELWYPKPESILRLTLQRLRNIKGSDFNKKVFPMYLYSRDCQVRSIK